MSAESLGKLAEEITRLQSEFDKNALSWSRSQLDRASEEIDAKTKQFFASAAVPIGGSSAGTLRATTAIAWLRAAKAEDDALRAAGFTPLVSVAARCEAMKREVREQIMRDTSPV